MVIGYILAILVGVSLGLIGSGGSILAIPILVYILGVDPVLATGYSLFIVGVTSLVGGIRNAFSGLVNFRTVFLFGIPSIVAVYITRLYLLPLIPETIFSISGFTLTKPLAIMILFAVVMIASAVSMIRPINEEKLVEKTQGKTRYSMILLEGTVVGVLTGLVGAGGGFLIIPALVLFGGMQMKEAISTSLFIIAAKSLIGFLGDLQADYAMDWTLLLSFTSLAVIGIFLGLLIAKKSKNEKLKVFFGWAVLAMGIFILIKELIL